MESARVCTHTENELLPVLEELRRREPIFHSPEFGSSTTDYERSTASDYWEVGASGRRYSRDFILQNLYDKPPAFADSLGWKSWDHALRRLGPDTYIITYVLQQGDRLTRRATIWQSAPGGWRILYHQGTVVSAERTTWPLRRQFLSVRFLTFGVVTQIWKTGATSRGDRTQIRVDDDRNVE